MYLLTKNVVAGAVVALTSAFSGFLIGANASSPSAKISGKGLFPWADVQVEYFTLTPTPDDVVKYLAALAVLALIAFGGFLFFDNRDARRFKD